jgi:hypothetical protein
MGAFLGGLAKKFVEHKISNVKKKVGLGGPTNVPGAGGSSGSPGGSLSGAPGASGGIHFTNQGPIPIAPAETSPSPSATPMKHSPSYWEE